MPSVLQYTGPHAGLLIRLLVMTSFTLLAASCARMNPAESGGTDPLVIDEAARHRIDSTLSHFVESGRIMGVSALIWEKDNEVYYNAFGFADREANLRMERNTIVRIYSMTKPITGAALMTLHEKGLFTLDDPVAKYIPDFGRVTVLAEADRSGKPVLEPPRRPITIRDLTRHTAGFAGNDHPQLGALIKEADAMNPRNTLAEMAQKLASVPLADHPGEQWIYGPSVDVQALLVERLSGKPFDRYLQETIFDPLKMTATRYVVAENDKGRLAAMYRRADGVLTKIADEQVLSFNTRDWPLKPGGFGLTSTIDDYMRFARMLVNEGTLDNTRILDPETVRLMATNHLADSVTERMWLPSKGQVGFGIDFAVRLRSPSSPVEKNGIAGEFFWDGAASTLFWVDPVNEVTAVMLVQIFPFDNDLHKAFRDAVYGPYAVR